MSAHFQQQQKQTKQKKKQKSLSKLNCVEINNSQWQSTFVECVFLYSHFLLLFFASSNINNTNKL